MLVDTEEVIEFLMKSYVELGKDAAELESRIDMVQREIAENGTYTQTLEELTIGAKMAWRNSNRCVGRLFWDRIQVVDARAAVTVSEIRDALFEHIRKATNGGQIRPFITIFKPGSDGPRIWNHQLIRYAGYASENGDIIGDPASVSFTEVCERIGWCGARGEFDILPLVIQESADATPTVIEIPPELVLEVPIAHPDFPQVAELGLRWYAVPIISEMKLEIGGVTYQAAPFNGWYMETEIGARNFADEGRYNKLAAVAEKLGLNTKRLDSLWKDRALVELNVAVLDSYHKTKVQIVDHHTAARQFGQFETNEQAAGREVTGEWAWLIPPVSPATTHMFHQRYPNKIVKPNFFYQDAPFERTEITPVKRGGCPFH
ncbi:nitric oxide synthase oxygenase [Listeria sp. FSL L7-1582]|uniref:nitric oxide synthase oxygenase n=1 Tax=Listeria portnoyi TaxID=2713504 RepID=UPI00164E6B8E|nr:nitric oxide synthase oxygenase [Listeria portnoyi]MBC6309880.1 nitric oxide synthase oxygenase [Listeria portnoyi]